MLKKIILKKSINTSQLMCLIIFYIIKFFDLCFNNYIKMLVNRLFIYLLNLYKNNILIK